MALQSFEKGDWVRATSREGELVHGFVVDVNATKEMMKVHVMESDNEIIIGKAIWILYRYAVRLSFDSPKSDSELIALIDLALITRDEQWFNELSEKLSYIRKPDNKMRKTSFFLDEKRLENIDNKQ